MAGIDDAWERHRRWSRVADEISDSLRRWRSGNLSLIVVGAISSTLAAQDGWFSTGTRTILGAVAAAALALAGIVQNRFLAGDRVRTRVDARAVAESLKSAVYQYLAGVAPFAGPDREDRLLAKIDAAQEQAKSLLPLAIIAEPDSMPLPDVAGVADYLGERAEDQARWHGERVGRHLRRARLWRRAELAATVTAAVLAAVGGVLHGTDLSAWVAVATTIGAALAAHIAGGQDDRVAASYASTAEELRRLLRRFDAATATTEEAARFVADTERVLASQNASWASLVSQG